MQDFRDAVRALRATPIVSAIAVLSLALGIGANTAIFSILNSLMLRTLPVREPQQLAMLDQAGESRRISWSNPIWEQIRERRDLFAGSFAWASTRFNLSQSGQTEMVDGLWASGEYFDVLGVKALLGRTLTTDDDRRGGGPDGPVAVISYDFWQKRFNGASDAIGKSLTVERVPFTIVGVTPPDFFGVDVGRTFDVAIPLGAEPLIRGKESSLDRRSTWWLSVFVRLKPAQTLESATTTLRGVQPQIREATLPPDYRADNLARYLMTPLQLNSAANGRSFLRTRYERPLTTIMVVVGLVLLIACANIANLLLARANARRHEISVRLALGASRLRLMRQLLVESMLLSAVGAAVGLLFAHWGSRLLVRQLSTATTNVYLDLTLDWRVMAFTSVVAILTALLFGVAPAFRASGVQPNDALKEQGRGNSTDRRFSLGNLLVISQVALSLVLVIAAGLFIRTFSSLASVDLGFQRDPVVAVSANAQRLQLEPAQRAPLFERLRQAAETVPGVESAAISAITPVSGSMWNGLFEFPGEPAREERERIVNINLISKHFFKTLGTRLIAGRDFTDGDRQGTPLVAVVNEAFATKYYGGASPLGKTVRQPGFGREPDTNYEIVGLVQDSVYLSVRDPLTPTFYVALSQHREPPSSVNVSVRAAGGSPALLIRPLAEALGTVDRNVALTFRLMGEQVNASLVQERIVAMLSGFFGGLALLLAGLGLYGVTSYAVSRRQTELGIRMALGAAPTGVVRLVLTRVALLVTVGLGAGVALALVLIKLSAARIEGLLFGIELKDPLTFATAAVILAAIGALAGFIPARRASRIDPAVVLRQ
jgi:putative ABC transport system permease protein